MPLKQGIAERLGKSHVAPVSYDSEKTAILAVIVNLIVALLRFVLAYFSHSVALMGDAWHHLKDVAASLSIYVSIRLSKIRWKRFAYGLYKLEDLAALSMSVLIFYVGYELIEEILFTAHREVQWIPETLIFLFLSLAIKFLFGSYEHHVAHHTHSPGLLADARHFFADVWSTLVVMIGLGGEFFHLELEKAATFGVVAIIWWNAALTCFRAVISLLDIGIDSDLQTKMIDVLKEPDIVQDVTLFTRKAGCRIFVEADLDIRSQVNYETATHLCMQLEQTLYQLFPEIARTRIHYHIWQEE